MNRQDSGEKSLPPPPRSPDTAPGSVGLDSREFKYAPPPSLSQSEQVSRAAGQPRGSQHNPISLLDGIPEVKKAKEFYRSFQNFVHPQKPNERPPFGINGSHSSSHLVVRPVTYQAPQAAYQNRPYLQTYNQTGPAYVPGPFANRPSGQPLRPTDPDWKSATTAADLKYDRMNYTTPVPTTPVRPNAIDLTSTESDTYVDPTKAQDEIKQLVESLQEVDEFTALPDNPKDLTVNLLKHQQMGLLFMKARETGTNKNGGILADDMGLGKTIQTLALMLENRPKNAERKTTLIIAPLALIRQWESEINTKTKPGTLKVLVHHGPGRTKNAATLAMHDVVITTYQVIVSEWPSPPKKVNRKSKPLATPKASSNVIKRTPRRVIDSSDEEASNPSDDSYPSDDSFTESSNSRSSSKAPTRNGLTAAGPLFEMDFFRIVLDEAQTIKNRSSKASQACSKIRSDKRWCLTGTPIQNTVEDLYSLFRFLRIKPYDDYPTFKTQIVTLVAQGRGKLAMRRLHVILKAIMLRRTKATLIDGKPLLQLPKRTVHSVVADFSKEEREFYEALENRTKLTLNKFVTAGTVNSNYTNILCLLLRLRQACNHPELVTRSLRSDPDAIEARPATVSANDKEVDDVADLLQGLSVGSKSKVKIQRCDICLEELQKAEITAAQGPVYCNQCAPNMELQRQVRAVAELIISTKIERMMNVLQQTKQRDVTAKTIIFSQFTSMLDLIEPFLKKQEYKFARYDGSMPNAKREASLDALRGDPATTILLISLKCGSLGLNLTAAEQVILLDVWWNPAVEDQAVDRSHRIGQLRDVNVYKITIKDTVEDRILVLQENKRKLAEGALGDGDKAKSKLNKLSIRDIMYLFRHDSKDAESDED